MQRLHRRSGVLATVGQRVCVASGLTFTNGRVSTVVSQADLAEAVMCVAAASARIAEAVDFELAKPERTQRDFSQEVEHELVERKVGVERTHTIVGQSGHKHHPTLFVPAARALVEPIGAEARWTRATAVYALFGDVMKVNGFSRYAVIDHRGDHVNDEIQNLLQRVGSLVYWSDRVPWMERVARQRAPRSGARRTRRASHHRTRALAAQRPSPRGWIFLTRDAHIRYRSAETTALHQAGLGAPGHSSG